MAWRSDAGPMDFEYQNKTGPLDHRSPFANVSGNHQPIGSMVHESPSRKRAANQGFGSPSKPTRQPSFPQNSSFKSSSPTRLFNSFSTPRKMDVDMTSSGGETPKSPEPSSMLDSDATPDNGSLNFRNKPVFLDDDRPYLEPTPSSKKASSKQINKVAEKERQKRRESLLWRAANFFISSPTTSPHASGKGQIVRGPSNKDTKIVKKREKDSRGQAVKRLLRMRGDSISDSEEPRPRSPSKSKKKRLFSSRKGAPTPAAPEPPKRGRVAGFFSFLTEHPTLPQILSWYAQLTLNFFLVASLIYLLWSFYATIRSDIDKKSAEAAGELMAEMAICARQYTDNRCEPETRVPAMETVCNNWEACMRRDVKTLGRAKISVHAWAEVFNAFVEPISWKAMIFSLFMIFGCVALSNLPFSMIRARAEQQQQQQQQQQAAANHHHYYGSNVPQTPGRHFSNPADMPNPYFTPHLGLEPQPSPGTRAIGGADQEIPTRKAIDYHR